MIPCKPILVSAALILSPFVTSIATAGPAGASPVQFTSVRLNTGVTLQVAQRGPASGEPMLFLHGFTDSWFSYSRVLDGLPSQVRAIVPTQRGHGDSERPACCYRLGDFVGDAVALLDALGIARATVVGHSMGSFVAQRIAIEHPTRVNRLVLIGSGATVRTPPVLEFNESIRNLADPVSAGYIREFQASTITRPVPSTFLDTVVHESEKVPARVWRDALAGLIAADAPQDLPRIQATTLIIWGDQDGLLGQAEQDGLVRGLRDARLVTYRSTGHAPHWEEPARVLADLRTFMAANSATSAAPAAAAASTAPELSAGGPPSREGQAHATHGDHTTHAAPAGKRTSDEMPLLPGLGSWHLPITTASPQAQRYFDQGLSLTYAFNHEEALRSFERATQLDPQCAMCYWGIAYAVGPNINLPMDAKAETRAFAAIRTAVSVSAKATPSERALIEAMATRFGEPAGAARAERDAAYAAAMRQVAQRFPSDVDVQTLFADAMLNTRPWNYWTKDGQPQPGTDEVVAALEHALTREPNHAGACHFYIHTVEASRTPERALACAERLPRLMPGAGHLVHMPAHVFLRVGRYDAAARANIAAVDADNQYIASRELKSGFYPMFYAPHNLHFLWAAYMLSGQREKAIEASRELADRVAIEDARATAALQGFMPAKFLTLVRFADWQAVLDEPAPPADLQYVRGLWHYARGIAFAARGDTRAARTELDHLRGIADRVKDDVIIMLNPARTLLKLAVQVLTAQIAYAEKRTDDAIVQFQSAAQIEDSLTYDEPPPWYHSVRHMLGETLLAAGRPAQAEQAFREDLEHLRETGWSLSGLERALRAQDKAQEADQVTVRLKEAWRHADVPARARSN